MCFSIGIGFIHFRVKSCIKYTVISFPDLACKRKISSDQKHSFKPSESVINIILFMNLFLDVLKEKPCSSKNWEPLRREGLGALPSPRHQGASQSPSMSQGQ